MKTSTFLIFVTVFMLIMVGLAGITVYTDYKEREDAAAIAHRLTGCNGGPCYTMDEIETYVETMKSLQSSNH